MYGNPYINQQNNIDRINNQIQELERMKTNFQNLPQQPQNTPINIYNNTNSSQNDFKAQYIDENTKVEDLLIQCKTAFICLKNRQLAIKELNGDITTYEIVIPKTELEIENDNLKAKLREMEMKINGLEYSKTNDEKQKSSKYDSKSNKD